MTQPLTAFASTTPAGETPLDPSLRPRQASILVQVGLGLWISSGMVAGGVIAIALRIPTLGEALAICALGLVSSFVSFVVWTQARLKRFNRAMARPLDALARGHFNEAETLYLALAQGHRVYPTMQCTALYNVAFSLAMRGDIETSIALAKALVAFKATKRTKLLPQIFALLASCCVQIDRLDDARAFVASALERNTTLPAASFSSIEAAALIREGRFEEAEALFERDWHAFEARFTVPTFRRIAAQRAFVLTQLGRPEVDIARLVAIARPSRGDEHVVLTVGWPSMRDFLITRGLFSA